MSKERRRSKQLQSERRRREAIQSGIDNLKEMLIQSEDSAKTFDEHRRDRDLKATDVLAKAIREIEVQHRKIMVLEGKAAEALALNHQLKEALAHKLAHERSQPSHRPPLAPKHSPK